LTFGVASVEVKTVAGAERHWELEEVKAKELGHSVIAIIDFDVKFVLG